MASSSEPRPTGSSHTASHLAPTTRDDDTISLRSVSEQDSDSEDDEVLHGARNSSEIAQHDRSVLEQEDEREKLLAGGGEGSLGRLFKGPFGNASRVTVGRRERRREQRRERRRQKKDRLLAKSSEDGELMYELEEGGLKSDASSVSSDASSELDRRKLRTVFEKKNRPSRCCGMFVIHLAILVLFVILLLVAYQLSRPFRSSHADLTLSNGTSNFAPTTILISLDGFRADFLNRNLTPTLNGFIAEGISPKYMLPSFPSVTFPNHFTLVTGLYPESHGIVGNTFWDPSMGEEFYYTDPARSMQPKWWGGEPLWVTAEEQGVMSAIHMWPGSEAHIDGVEPTYLDKYNGSEVLARKVQRVLDLVDMPGPDEPSARSGHVRPQFIAAYVPVVDADGHKYGPNSTEIRDTIKSVDEMLHDLFAGLTARNLTNVVNVVVVSDHGMATTSTDRLIQLEDLLDPDTIEHIDGWPLYGLRPKSGVDLQELYHHLRDEAEQSPRFDVYLRDENMPERYHFSRNERIAPLWIVPQAGWAIVTMDEFDVAKGKQHGEIYHPRGLHGYDHEHPLMRAIFVARGPAFPHQPNSRVDVFQNTEVYNIVCDTLGIEPNPNNGTLRLPLKAAGLHSDEGESPLETPPDPSPSSSPSPSSFSSPSPSSSPTAAIGVDRPGATRPVVDDHESSPTSPSGGGGGEGGSKDRMKAFFEYFKSKVEAFKGWFHSVLNAEKSEPEPESESESESG